MSPKNRFMKKPYLNRFYLGASDMARLIGKGQNPTNTFTTIEEATDAAKTRVEDNETQCEIVVRIVRIVKRSKPPVKIENV